MSWAGAEKILMLAAKVAYNNYTDNHPTIHSNRFPSWEELDQKEKEKWKRIVQQDALH